MLGRTLLAATLLFVAGVSQAALITYEGQLFDGIPATGQVSASGDIDSSDSALSDYWSFFGNAGDLVSIAVTRLETAFDPVMWIFEGVFNDSGTGSLFDFDLLALVDIFDDEVAVPGGPLGDPAGTFTLPTTGLYTAIVTNGLSDPEQGGDGLFDYQILANGVSPVPVPAAFPLFLSGLGVLAFLRRRRMTGQ